MYIQADQDGIKTTTADKSWRLVYNGVQVMDLAEQDFVIAAGGSTEIFVVATKEEAEAEIARLNLVLPEHLK